MKAHYSTPQKLLHWLSAVIIIWTLVSGFSLALVNWSPPVKLILADFNVALNTLFTPFFFLRIYYRWKHGVPASHQHDGLGAIAAAVVHGLLYWVTVAVLVTGLLMMDRDINLFGLLHISPVVTSLYWQGLLHTVHIGLCVTLLLLVVTHVGAVFMHALNGRSVMGRMKF
ncbi:cytochrome b [Pseudomonas fontis]|uniref:Cytochrome b/b6 domain-containing protein n=1 Tax=Pseudomonas fontis TaxID=2942633 RepID=A0ABT5NQ76_9PSED|nr:cytochrome b/b6 domain-containing protein [Pseudomonas fontis]MDD0972837.1 cytochrome b/b6 domain-containing protein [Pseudomonas fontis]MDD0990294.1 cytochrome b/b6 domain-containing protein [Pseudomonas fontis]